jgi:hypothetical protein
VGQHNPLRGRSEFCHLAPPLVRPHTPLATGSGAGVLSNAHSIPFHGTGQAPVRFASASGWVEVAESQVFFDSERQYQHRLPLVADRSGQPASMTP